MMKRLDKVFLILVLSIIVFFGVLSQNTFNSISIQARQVVINQFLSSSKTISKAIQKDIFAGDYIGAWKNTYQALQADEHSFFMILDKENNDLVNDLDASLKYQEVMSNNEWRNIILDKYVSYKISKDNKLLIVSNSFLDERSGEVRSFKILFAYDLGNLVDSSKTIASRYYQFVLITIVMIVLYFVIIRKYFKRSFRGLITSVRTILTGGIDKDDNSAVHYYFEFKNFLNRFRKEFEETQKKLDIKAREAALSELASQVAHDIRSPLAALNTAIQTDTVIDHERRNLMFLSLERIRNISEDLLTRKRNNEKKEVTISEIASLVDELLLEKKQKLVEKRVNLFFPEKYENEVSTLLLNKVDFNRTLSNIINNSLDAFTKFSGNIISINLNVRQSCLEIEVKDNGKGMPEDILEKVKNKSFSWNKKDGNGLGVKSVRDFASRHFGSFSIASKEGVGTSVTISLPISHHKEIINCPTVKTLASDSFNYEIT